ncbi:MAG: hypothetical protein JM58_06220 [Peptococcaceae bacterium BICA1-8]|nr:MAG: hypothetical protein JM58_06220 [Peptococcaceae bacterium BICA1-8]
MFKWKHSRIVFWISIMTILIFTGCFGSPQAKPEFKPKIKVGLVLAETNSARNQYLIAKMKESAKSLNIKLIEGDSKNNSEQQKTQIEKMIKEKVEAVIMQPINSDVAKDFISMLEEQNIKIVIIDLLPENVSVDAFIAPDYVKVGELQAQYILSPEIELKPLIIIGEPNSISGKILSGNLKQLKNSSLVKDLGVKEVPDKSTSKAYEISKNEYSKNSPNAIIAHYEQYTSGIMKFLKETKLEKKVAFVTMDINKESLPDILEGNLIAVDTMPNLLAQVILETTDSLLKTDSWKYDMQINNGTALVPAKYTPVRIINIDNLYLLNERFPELEKLIKSGQITIPKQENKNEKQQKKTKLKVKTTDGKEYEVTIPGEIEKVEMMPDEKQE